MSEDKRGGSNKSLVENSIDNLLGQGLALDVDDHIDHGVVDNDDDDVGDIVDCDVVEHEADNLVVPLRTDDTDGKDGTNHAPTSPTHVFSTLHFTGSAFYGRASFNSAFYESAFHQLGGAEKWS